MSQPRALISGAGVAGLSLAFWLLKAGWTVTLVEIAPSLRTGGYKIDVRGVAVEVIRRMSVLETARANALHMTTSAIVNRRGKSIATIPADTIEGRVGDDFELVRGDLIQLLADALGERAHWLLGDSITSLVETADGITATFSKSPTQDFDAVFGADGLHSRVRALTFGAETQFSKPLGAYVCVFPAPLLDIPETTELMYPVGAGKSLIVYRTAPSEPAMVMLLFRAKFPESLLRRSAVTAQKQLVRETFAQGGWITAAVLAQLDAASDLYFDTVSQVHMPSWSKGRVALLGDAAYCATLASGQGSSLALVGAYVLAQALRNPSTYQQAFRTYEANLRAFAAANQNLAQGNLAAMVPKTRALITVQTLMLRLMPYLPGKNYIVRRIVEPVQKAAHALDLSTI